MNLKNIPIPEPIIFPLLIGIAIEVVFPMKLFQQTTASFLFVFLLLSAGLFLMIWSVIAAGKLDVSSPDSLLTTGPYAISRNPMYVSWLIIYIATLIFMRSTWLVLGFVVAFLLTHYLAILPEERYLLKKFGDSFVSYCETVRRYF